MTERKVLSVVGEMLAERLDDEATMNSEATTVTISADLFFAVLGFLNFYFTTGNGFKGSRDEHTVQLKYTFDGDLPAWQPFCACGWIGLADRDKRNAESEAESHVLAMGTKK